MRHLTLGLLLTLVAFAGCEDDDPVGVGSGGDPGGDVEWMPMVLPEEVGPGGVFDFASGAGRTVALASSEGRGTWVIEYVDGDWVAIGDEPFDDSAWVWQHAMTVDEPGRVHVVGSRSGGTEQALVWSETETGWALSEGPDASGTLVAAVPDGVESIIAAGRHKFGNRTTGNAPVVRGSAPTLTFDTMTPPSGAHTVGIVDLARAGGSVFALGLASYVPDSFQPRECVLMRHDDPDWTVVPDPCEADSGHVASSIAGSATHLYIGGSIVEPGEGSKEVAWLAKYTFADETWTDIPLPDADQIVRIRDVLVASDGTVYLATGELDVPLVDAFLLRVSTDDQATIEWRKSDAFMAGLGELPDGTIVAGGATLGASVSLLLERR